MTKKLRIGGAAVDRVTHFLHASNGMEVVHPRKIGTIYVLALTWLHLGCSPDDRIHVTEIPGSAGSSSSSSSGSSSASSSSGGEIDDGMPLQCIPGAQPQGPLCGPSSAPCRVLIDEQIPTTPALRDEMPALVLMPKCTPWILFSAKQDGAYNGFEAVRDTDGQWSVHETPFDFATAGLVLSKSGSLFALPNDGAYGTSLWGFTADGWVKMNDVPVPVAHVAPGVAIGNEETIYAGFRTDQSEVMLGSFNGTWLLSKLGDSVDFPTIGLSPKGEPQVAWSQDKGALDVNRIYWQAPPLNSQVACASLGNTSYGIRRTQLAVTAADAANPRGKPHLFVYERIIGLPAQSHSLNYVTYAYSSDIGSNAWIDVPVASSSTYLLVPLGMIGDDTGDIRFFYAIYDPGTGIPEVRIAWKEADGMKSAVVLSGKEVREASFALDGAGNVHIAMYVLAEGGTRNVQYLVLGI